MGIQPRYLSKKDLAAMLEASLKSTGKERKSA